MSLTVECKWVPGTFDQIELLLLETGEHKTIHMSTVYKLMGRKVADDLYLTGKARFEGDAELLPLFDLDTGQPALARR